MLDYFVKVEQLHAMANETAAPAQTTPPAPTSSQKPANTVTTQNEPKAALVGVDIASLTPAQVEALANGVSQTIPRDERGRARRSPEVNVAEPPVTAKTEAPKEELPEPTWTEVPPVETPTEPTAEEPTSEVETPVEEPKASEQIEEAEEPGKLPQHRARANNTFDDLVLRRYKNAQLDGKPITMEQCIAAEKAAQGIIQPVTQVTPTKSVQTAKAERDAILEDIDKAEDAYDIESKKKLNRALIAKNDEIRDLEEDAKARNQAAAFQAEKAKNDAITNALRLYPDFAADPKTNKFTPLGEKLNSAKDRIWAEHVANRDPILDRPDYLLKLAQMAAAEVGIAPKSVTTPTRSAQSRSVQPAKPAPPLASASARTTTPGKGQTAVAALDGIKSMRDLTAITDKLLPSRS